MEMLIPKWYCQKLQRKKFLNNFLKKLDFGGEQLQRV
jgi:hypothetical protein